jgi:hypothetical protein
MDKAPQTVVDYEGGGGMGVKCPTNINAVDTISTDGAHEPPGEDQRYGGKGFAGRVADACKPVK